jgi:hypothetical protein
MTRRTFHSRRRRAPLALGSSFGFLRPSRRHEEDQEEFLQRLREEPELRREYRASLAVQLTVVGVLMLAVFGLVIQSTVVLRKLRIPGGPNIGWLLPFLVGCLGLLVFRRFLRLWSDYRRMR